MPTSRPSTILVADDTEFMRKLVRSCLKEAGLYADIFGSAPDLLAALTGDTQVCILDLKMPGMDGLECLREIKQRHPRVEVVMLTGVNEAREALAAVRAGAFDYLTKPFDPAELARVVRKALQRARAATAVTEAATETAGDTATLAGKSLDAIELLALRQTLEACGDNRAEAARQLGVSEKTIYNMMRRHSLAKDQP